VLYIKNYNSFIILVVELIFNAGLVFKAVLGTKIIGQVAIAFFGVISLGWGYLAFSMLASRNNSIFGIKGLKEVLNKPTC
jgi:hypothetical protein